MAEKVDQKELVSFKELLMTNTVQVDAATQLLIERGVFTEDEFYARLEEVTMNIERSWGIVRIIGENVVHP
jgi:hypothetical protein